MSGSFSPGDLVFARGREWVTLPAPAPDILRLRPLSGGEEDTQLLLPAPEPVRPARFAPPGIEQRATQDAAQLLADAQALALRRGAGPFRSAARLGFEPRAYQLVPLLMALRLPVVRLLIADDVGTGKTIEAGLILRELIDRGETDRFTILCPPHLIEQWTGELRQKFDLDATAVTAASAGRLERGLPPSQTLFDIYPYTVVSLDYIKADRRRASFAGACPGFVIVDEAHACTGANQGRQQRFSLLRDLASDPARHMVLLSATPHSGDAEAFDRLLSLLDKDFSGQSMQDNKRRERLARHLVQRRRRDITEGEWDESRAFPRHETAEATYALTPDLRAFNDALLDYCLGVVEGAGADQNNRRLAFWGTLALMRCAGSSPEAALRALRNRGQTNPLELAVQMMDSDGDTNEAPDNEPAALSGDASLDALITQAARLARGADPKRDKLIAELRPLIAQGMNPVVFCRFIATAEHVAAGLRAAFPKLEIQPVTGLLPPDDRRARVEAMAAHERRILVATDCLSEGINLQSLFDAVVHYDLSWNPTRHQQREGRVNRFGQPAKTVRSITLYSPDSAIDGAVLDVILRKSERIRRATGITVTPLEDQGTVSRALMHAVLLRRKTTAKQLAFDFGAEAALETMDTAWRDAEANETRSRAIFAQNAMKPAAVLPEWQRWRDLLGKPDELVGFVRRALLRLGAPLADLPEGAMRAQLDDLPTSLRERLAGRGLSGAFIMGFTEPPPSGAAMISRNHPLPAILAEAALEAALDSSSGSFPGIGRIGAWPSTGVTRLTTILLLRLRFKLALSRNDQLLLAEDAACLAFGPSDDTPVAESCSARALLAIPASHDLAEPARQRIAAQSLARLPSLHPAIAAYAERRAVALAADHARVREAGANVPRVTVTPVLPADIIGLFTLIPAP